MFQSKLGCGKTRTLLCFDLCLICLTNFVLWEDRPTMGHPGAIRQETGSDVWFRSTAVAMTVLGHCLRLHVCYCWCVAGKTVLWCVAGFCSTNDG